MQHVTLTWKPGYRLVCRTLSFLLSARCRGQSIATSSTKLGMTAKRVNHEEMFSRMEHVITGDDPDVSEA